MDIERRGLEMDLTPFVVESVDECCRPSGAMPCHRLAGRQADMRVEMMIDQIFPEQLVPGETYFIVMYADESLTIPLVQTLIYLEPRSLANASTVFIFRELHPHSAETVFSVRADDVESLLLDQRGLINRLENSQSVNSGEYRRKAGSKARSE